MATYANFLRKLVTAYFDDRKTKKDDNFSHVRLAMQEISVKDRENIAALLTEMAQAVRTTACQHTDVNKPDAQHETCNICGYKRFQFSTGREEDDNIEWHWSAWRKVVTQKLS